MTTNNGSRLKSNPTWQLNPIPGRWPVPAVVKGTKPAAPTSIAIVEGGRKTSGRLAGRFARSDHFQYLGRHRSGENALADLPVKRPDMILLETHLPDMSGIECLGRLKQLLPEAQIVVLIAAEPSDQVFRTLAAGASGCLSRNASCDEILAALGKIQSAGPSLNHEIARKILEFFQGSYPHPAIAKKLSERQLEVMELLTLGKKFEQMAGLMGVGLETVKTHVRRLYKKLQVQSRSQAVAVYTQSFRIGP